MTVGPMSGQTPVAPGSSGGLARSAQWAVRLAVVAAALVAIAVAVFGVAYAAGGPEATEDNWVGALTVLSFLGGLLVSLVAFAVAVWARVMNVRSTMLWLALSVFPALVLFVVLGEGFWWE